MNYLVALTVASVSITKRLRRQLSKLPEGQVFDYASLFTNPKDTESILRELSRLEQEGKLVRLKNGIYHKAKHTRFGKLRPTEEELIKGLTQKGGQITGYPTGSSLYHRYGLTTQVSNVLEIAVQKRKPARTIEGYNIRFVPYKVPLLRRKYIPYLQLLDVLADLKKIPDTSPGSTVTIMSRHLQTLWHEDVSLLTKLALHYSPATRALLGAMLEHYCPGADSAPLHKSLNSLSRYTLGVSASTLPNAASWNIQ